MQAHSQRLPASRADDYGARLGFARHMIGITQMAQAIDPHAQNWQASRGSEFDQIDRSVSTGSRVSNWTR